MTLLEHVRFDFQLVLLRDAHLGDGRLRSLSELRPGDSARTGRFGESVDPDIATVVRSYESRREGLPTIPATALKGALRRRLELSLPESEIQRLFGTVKTATVGAMGQFTFYAAKYLGCSGTTEDLPYWRDELGTWVATQVAIDRKTGAADHRKLFNLELVPAGTTFRVEGMYFGTMEQAATDLVAVLAPLAGTEGLSIGSGERLGLGGARLVGQQVRCTATLFDPASRTASLETSVLTVSAPSDAQLRTETLALACPGPFSSVDPQRQRRGNEIAALRYDEATPLLRPSGIAGALRSRAAWLAASGPQPTRDDRFRKPSTWADPSELTPVERLFGVSGWRGLVRIAHVESLGTPRKVDMIQIGLDRFSGAVLDGTLFSHEAFCDLHFQVTLSLATRIHKNKLYPLPTDLRLFEALLTDLDEDILLLGHATNRGFGWFDVNLVTRGVG